MKNRAGSLFMKLLLAALVAGLVGSPGLLRGETIFGIDLSNRLYSFDSASPGTPVFVNGGAPVSGLQPEEEMLAIDFRPVATNAPDASSNGVLYGVSSNNRLYTINTTTAAATSVGVAGNFTLNGNAFGMDFNPASGLLGIVSDTGQNIRLNPFNGMLAATDNELTYAAGDSGFGLSPRITGSAFTNNFGGAAQTTLFGIDFERNALVRQGGANGAPSPAGGQLTTIGVLGLDFVDQVGFDLSGATGTAYASLSPVIGPQDPSSGLYVIDLTSAQMTRVGSIGPAGGVAAFVTRDIAVPLGVPIPEPASCILAVVALAVVGVLRRRVA
jgi:Domain of unknown function (DUF4394)